MNKNTFVLAAMFGALTLAGCTSDSGGTEADSGASTDSGDVTADGGALADGGAATVDGGTGSGDAGQQPPNPGEAIDPAEPGRYASQTEDRTVALGTDQATVTVCSPSSDGGATAAPGPWPMVVASPGFMIERSQYRSMCEHLASWGYVAIVQTLPGNIFSPVNHRVLAERTLALIDWALGSDSGLAARIDAAAIATAGHSLGGKVSILAAILDSRIGAVVGWDPVDAKPPLNNGSPSVSPELMEGLTVPLAVLGETLDGRGGFMPCAPLAENYQQYFQTACAAPSAVEVTIADADHMDWVDDRATCDACGLCSMGTVDDAATRRITRRVTVAFLETHLRGNTAMQRFFGADVGDGATVRARSTAGCP